MSKFKNYILEDVGTIETVKGVNNDALVSLTNYMIDKGLNVKPLPKVKVVAHDKENADKLLGDTGGYDHNNKIITLYTMGRHPEDVFRSFTHEMVHHIQNLEGRLEHTPTQNVNKDSALEHLEEEANRRGNMIFRAWKDETINRT